MGALEKRAEDSKKKGNLLDVVIEKEKNKADKTKLEILKELNKQKSGVNYKWAIVGFAFLVVAGAGIYLYRQNEDTQ